MHIIFVHTPMAHRRVPGRRLFWHNFDLRYYATHLNATPMENYLWELPHWITWLGGVLEQNGFTSMEVLDFYTHHGVLDGIDLNGIYDSLTDHPADVYLFSPMTPNLPHALKIADMIKALHPKSIVVFGGIVASPLYKEVVKHRSVDFVVIDRGEYALPELLKAIQDRGDISKVGNLAYRAVDNQVVTNPYRYPPMPVADIPFPKIDLFPRSVGEDIRYIRQVYALGCPYQCSFCSIQTIGHRPSYFPVDRVLSEIRAYRAYYGQHHHIYFGDETFTLHTDRTLELCEALEAEGGIVYDCQTRLNRLQDPRLPQALYNSGCRWIEVGIETANQQSLDLSNKRSKITQAEETLARLRDAGIPTCAFMIVGFPNESIEDMQRTVEWSCSLLNRGLLHASYLFGLVPYPGTPMYIHPERYGMTIRHRDYEFYHEDLLPVYDTRFATAEQMYEVFLDGVKLIGEAMGEKPFLGEMATVVNEKVSYGAYWRDPL